MNLLVVDTATDRCALACSIDGEVFENTRSIPRMHNEYLLGMLKDLFEKAELNPRDLSAIGFAAGPGSFTGIRISAAVCQALAVGAAASVVPLSSSLLLAHAALQKPSSGGPVLGVQTVLRSRARFAYLASYAISDSEQLERIADDVLLDDGALLGAKVPPGWIRVMDASDTLARELGAVPVQLEVRDLLDLTQQAVSNGEALPPAGAQPRYVEGDTPWNPR